VASYRATLSLLVTENVCQIKQGMYGGGGGGSISGSRYSVG